MHGLSDQDRQTLLGLARASIDAALAEGRTEARTPSLAGVSEGLRRDGASFVTLRIGEALRGCVGSVEARRPLLVDVASNACAAAFRDPRFPALTADEWPEVSLSISVLTPMEPIDFADEEGLIGALRPGVDGLMIRAEGGRATFLPQVWESLPSPRDFLGQLKVKMGRDARWWSDGLQAWRYEVEKIE